MQLGSTDGEQKHLSCVCVYQSQLIEQPAGPEAVGVSLPLLLIPWLSLY